MARPVHDLTIIDFELTGTDIEAEDERIIAMGAIRFGRKPSEDVKREWFFNPGKPSRDDAFKIHGLTQQFLSQFPDFKSQYYDISLFLGKSRLVTHCWYRNSDDRSVDERALNAEFRRASHPETPHALWTNLKKIAEALSPEHTSLNDMLDRYRIDRKAREIHHGALIDAELTTKLLRAYQADPAAKKMLKKLDLF